MHIKLVDGQLYEMMIEVTRKCNFSCGHCLRGDAESKDFNPATLRKFLSQIPQLKSINTICFTGGEPLLVPHIIDECIDIFKQYDVSLNNYYIATNGSKFNIETVKVLTKLHDYCGECQDSSILISQSEWHEVDKNYIIPPSSGEDLWQTLADSVDTSHIDPEDYNNEFEYEDACIYELDQFFWQFPYGQYIHELPISLRPKLTSRDSLLFVGKFGTGEDSMEDIEKVTDDEDTLIYLNYTGKIIIDYCDVSYELQDRKAKDISQITVRNKSYV